MTQLSLLGEELRDIGVQRVLASQGTPWSAKAKHLMLEFLRSNGPALLEDARLHCESVGLPPPSHHNAWGAIASVLAGEGVIRMTGNWRPSRHPRSHARIQPEWAAI